MKMNERIFIEKEKRDNGSVIDKTYVSEDTKIYNNAKVSKSEIGPDCTIGDNAHILNSKLLCSNRINRRGQLVNVTIGAYSHTNHNTTVRDADIGKFCSISWNVSIGGTDHNYKSASTFNPSWWNDFFDHPEGLRTFEYPRCQIGNDVWIASGANILRKVKVGDGAVIGAGAIVTKDVPPYAIVTGVPAKVVKYRFPEETIEKLLKIKWWDWPKEVIRENIPLLHEDLDDDILAKMMKVSEGLGIL